MSGYQFEHVGNLNLGQEEHYNIALTDLEIGSYQGNTALFAASRAGGGVTVYTLESDQSISLSASWVIDPDQSLFQAPDIEFVTIQGVEYLASGGHADGAFAELATSMNWAELEIAGEPITHVLRFGQVAPDGPIYALLPTGAIVSITLNGMGNLEAVEQLPAAHSHSARLTDIEVFQADGRDYILGHCEDGHFLSLFEADETGRLHHRDIYGNGEGLAVGTPSDVEVFTQNGQTKIAVAGFDSDSLTILNLTSDATLTPADHIIGSQHNKLAQVSQIEAFTYEGESFIIGAGGADGLALFRVLDDGRLCFLSSIDDTFDTSLENTSALTTHMEGDTLNVFSAAEGNQPISQFTLSLTQVGQTQVASSVGEELIGAILDDVLRGSDGDDTLRGQSGDDILLDGDGADTLFGGVGEDLFMFDPDGEVDTIEDFNIFHDTLDLSAYGVTSLADVSYVYRGYGADIYIGSERLILKTDDGLGILPSAISDLQISDLSRYSLTRDTIHMNADGWQGISTGGSETIYGTQSADEVLGGAGDDTLFGRASADRLFGDDGNDTLIGGLGNDELFGGRNNDTLNGETGDDLLYGGAGDDTLIASAGSNIFYGESGKDTIHGGRDGDFIDGGNHGDWADGAQGNDRIFGGQGFDTVFGGEGNDTLFGQTENDKLYGGAGRDVLRGGSQEDLLVGDDGEDFLYGDGGFDRLEGGAGDDLLDGGGQADNLYGGEGNDTLYGGHGFDRLFGGDGDDIGYGGETGDTLFGQNGNDTLYGEGGDDRFWAGSGNDIAYGGEGNDTIGGGSGFDTLIGGAGDDILAGDFNADTFVFATNEGDFGHDVILDFDAANNFEKISFSDVLEVDNVDDLLNNFTQQSGSNVVIQFDQDNSITLNNVWLPELDAQDFLF